MVAAVEMCCRGLRESVFNTWWKERPCAGGHFELECLPKQEPTKGAAVCGEKKKTVLGSEEH